MVLEYLLLFSRPIMSDTLWPHGLRHTRPPCPSPSPGVCPSSCSFPQWCHPAISSSVALFSFCPQSFPASGTMFATDDQNTGASASPHSILLAGLPLNTMGRHPGLLCTTFREDLLCWKSALGWQWGPQGTTCGIASLLWYLKRIHTWQGMSALFQEKSEPVSTGRDPSPHQTRPAHFTDMETEVQSHRPTCPKSESELQQTWDQNTGASPGFPTSLPFPSLSSSYSSNCCCTSFLKSTFQTEAA